MSDVSSERMVFYLLLCNRSPPDLVLNSKHLLSDSFCGSGIREDRAGRSGSGWLMRLQSGGSA